jgi:hypothetical protein
VTLHINANKECPGEAETIERPGVQSGSEELDYAEPLLELMSRMRAKLTANDISTVLTKKAYVSHESYLSAAFIRKCHRMAQSQFPLPTP